MKNYNSKLIALLLVALSLNFSSCKKAEKGPAGPQGAPGKDGNANVKNLTIFVNANEWVYKPGTFEVTKLVPELTADIINKGAVMVYMGDTGSWEALPATNVDPDGFAVTFNYIIEAGKLILYGTYNSSVTMPAGTIESGDYKIVLIAGSARAANPNLNLLNYNEVQNTYNLTN